MKRTYIARGVRPDAAGQRIRPEIARTRFKARSQTVEPVPLSVADIALEGRK